jgi:branched-chain amino acid transport system permease protein
MSDEVGSAEATESGEVERSPSLYDRWLAVREREATIAVLTFVGVFLAPFILVVLPELLGIPRQYSWYRNLVILALIWGIFAIGFDLLLGFTGLLSFGHAMFWGTAAYTAGIFSANVTGSPIAMILVGTTAAVLLAWVIGWISLRRGGIYFAILTLAFGQMIYYIALSPLGNLTGGENGFTGVEVGPLLGFLPLGAEIAFVPDALVETWMYVLVGLMTVLAVVVGNRVLNSPYGIVLRAIRENEQRAEFVGLNVWRYKLMAFIISGAFAGVAGSLYVIQRSFVPIENTLNWTVSGEIVIMTVLGGVGSLFGPLLGAGLYMYVANIVSGMPTIGDFWHMILGLVFIAVVVLAPNGIWGRVEWLRERVGEALGGDDR